MTPVDMSLLHSIGIDTSTVHMRSTCLQAHKHGEIPAWRCPGFGPDWLHNLNSYSFCWLCLMLCFQGACNDLQRIKQVSVVSEQVQCLT